MLRRSLQRVSSLGRTALITPSMANNRKVDTCSHNARENDLPREIQIPLNSGTVVSMSGAEDVSGLFLQHHEPKRTFGMYVVGILKTFIVFSVATVLLLMVLETVFKQEPLEELNEALRMHFSFPNLNASINESLRERLNLAFPNFNASMMSLAESLHHSTTAEKQTVGETLAEEGATVNFPIVMIPGFVTSGLEIWSAKDCMKRFFRQRVWTAFTGAASLLVEKDCWVEHMMLDPRTGGDPEGIRVRASEGFMAADYFLMNYWVWGKIIRNLAEVGYTPSDMVMLSYDWRLPFELLEERDGYLTNLKARIESLHKTTGKKVVISTHSMGALLVHHFFGWVTSTEREGGGGGGAKWVDRHVEAYINIAGAHLGVPKAATALLSGEMSDTVFGGRIATFVEHFLPRRLRRDLFNSWGSLWAMLPKGGNRLWALGHDFCVERSDGDEFCPQSDRDLSPLIAMTGSSTNQDFVLDESVEHLRPLLTRLISGQAHDAESLLSFLQQFGSGLGSDTVGSKFHSQIGKDKKRRLWYDPSRSPLPHAPNMKIYCLYGFGLPTERGYYYKRNWDQNEDRPFLAQPSLVIDTDVGDEKNATVGIRYADGDGSVPLLSLGYICADAWQRPNSGLNPSKAKVYTREFEHRSEFCVDDPMRKGPTSSDHVDILGNSAMIEDVIRIVSGFEPPNKNRITSNILEIAKKINDHPKGGLFKGHWW